jgi:hypothetical protein
MSQQLTSEQIIRVKNKLTEWGVLDPRFDWNGSDPAKVIPHNDTWNSLCVSALLEFFELFDSDLEKDGIPDEVSFPFVISKWEPPSIKGEGAARAIAEWYKKENWFIARGTNVYNACYVEDAQKDFTPVAGRLDKYDDLLVLWQLEHNGTARLIKIYDKVTCEPSAIATYKRINPKGAPRKPSNIQVKAHAVGIHGSRPSTRHEAMVQVYNMKVIRDDNESGTRDKTDPIEVGLQMCNQHSTIGGSPDTIGAWSYGCDVQLDLSKHRERMALQKTDRRYQATNQYTFITSYIPGDSFYQFAKANKWL